MALSYSTELNTIGLYNFSYKDVIAKRLEFKEMSIKQFCKNNNLKQALHFAIFIGYIKEVDYLSLADNTAIHELSHRLCGIKTISKSKLKKLFLKFVKL